MPEGLFSHLLADDGLKWIYILLKLSTSHLLEAFFHLHLKEKLLFNFSKQGTTIYQ